MRNFKERKRNTIERMNSLEYKRDEYYDYTAMLGNEIDQLNEDIMEKCKQIITLEAQANTVNSYAEFLGKQLVIESLEQMNYSIENFDPTEEDRLLVALRNENELLFEWLVQKKQQGYTFNDMKPLQKVLKEDYESFCAEYKTKEK